MVLSKPSSNAPVLTRRWKQLITCYLLLLLLEILPLHPPLLVTPQMCCPWARMQDQLQLGNVFCYLAQLQRGRCWQGRAEQAAGELWPVLLNRNKGSCTLLCALPSKPLLCSAQLPGCSPTPKLSWEIGFFAVCEQRKMVFK